MENIQNVLKGQRRRKKAPPCCYSAASLLNINSAHDKRPSYRDGVDHFLDPNLKSKNTSTIVLNSVWISINLSMSSPFQRPRSSSNNCKEVLRVGHLLFYSNIMKIERNLLYQCSRLVVLQQYTMATQKISMAKRAAQQKKTEIHKALLTTSFQFF